MKTYVRYDRRLAELFLHREMFQTKVVEKIKIHSLSETFLRLEKIQRDVYHNE